MFIKGIGTALPLHRYSQSECWEALRSSSQFEKLNTRSRAILRKVLLGQNGIEARHLALERLEDAFELSTDALHARFLRNAPALGAAAARAACERSGTSLGDVDAILISTCTGYLCPGLTSYVSELLNLRPSVLALDLVGQGCVAALPNIATAMALVKAGRQNVLSVCVEVCSAAFYLDNDAGVLISACLFGDGAAAVIVGSGPGPGKRIELLASGATLASDNRDLLKIEQRSGMLRNILSPRVPNLAAEYVERVLSDTLARSGLSRSDITGWVLHPGGRDVLAAIQERLGLADRDVRSSLEVLRQHGNLSSPSVFFVLDHALKATSDGQPLRPTTGMGTARPNLWWMTAFGAGFSCQGALLKVE